MIARIHGRGFSFKGITAYLMHDKDAKTSERVAWSRTENMRTSDIEKAAKVMAWRDMHREDIRASNGASAAGAKPDKGRLHHAVLAWAVGENPDEDHQWETVQAYMAHQGMDHLQYYAVAHNDTKHIHVHIVSNLADPETGKIHKLGFEKHRAQKWALGYERDHGLHCPMREVHAAQRAQEGAKKYYVDKKTRYGIQITRAYEASDNGKSFINALALEGFTLAKGRKSYVAVGSDGDIVNLSKVIEGHKTTDIKAKLGDLGREKLPGADALSEELKARHAQALADREKDQQPEIRGRDRTATQERAEQQARKAAPRKQPAPAPVYKRVDRDRELAHEDSKRRVEIEDAKVQRNIGAHRAKLKDAERMVADRSDWLSRLLGDTRRAEEHAENMRLNLEDARKKQQQDIDAINRRYHHGPDPQAPAPKPEGVRLTRDYEKASTPARETGRKTQAPSPARQPLPDLGKMRTAAEVEESVKKQGWQDARADDPFSGLRPDLQGKAREAYRQAKEAELKRNEEQQQQEENIGRRRGPRPGRD